MKKSFYNFFYKMEEGILAYNAKSNAMAVIEADKLDAFKGIMEGKEMIVSFYCLGPSGSKFSIPAMQITDSAYVVHSELNAILNSNTDLTDCSIYVSLFPCNECAKAIIQSGIKEVYYLSDKYATSDSTIVSKKMFDMAGVRYTPLTFDCKEITLKFE